MTRALLDKEQQDLNAEVIRMGDLVDTALAQALEALETGDQDKAGAVVISDTPIDALHLTVEEHTFRILTLQQPLTGRDLRYLTSLVPIAIDLERIGDEAESIAQRVLSMLPVRGSQWQQAKPYVQQGHGKVDSDENKDLSEQSSEAAILTGLLKLGKEVRQLFQLTMKAFADRNAETARSLWEQDRVVDRNSYAVRRDVMTLFEGTHALPALQQDPHMVQRDTYLLWIAYQLERVADHCTNICERIVFIVEGETDMLGSLEE